jgi:hypothetical protein
MSEVMDEINEELRQQKLEQFWKENRNWIIASIILAILTTAGITWWRGWNNQQNLKATTQLLDISKANDPKALTEYAATARLNHAVLAKFLAAGMHVKQGNAARATEIYDEIAGMRGVDRPLRDLAALLSCGQRLGTDDPKKLHAELGELAGKKGPYRFTALEMDALVSARENKLQDAVEKLETISMSAEAPGDARMRAATLREFYAASATGAAPKKGDKK